MFDNDNLVSVRERAAVPALKTRLDPWVPWNRLAGAIEEQGSALGLLRDLDKQAEQRLFDVDQEKVTLDGLEERVLGWQDEGITLITVLDAAYPMNLRMVHDRPPALW